jgi:hypothetical protein
MPAIKEADVANAATDIQYVHPAADTSGQQHPFGKRPKQLALLDQSFVLVA